MTVAGTVSAQVRPGVKLGYNLGGVMGEYRGKPEDLKNTNGGDPGNFHMKSGFQVGLIADCPVNEAIAIQPGARFSMQGFTDKYHSGAVTGDEVTRKFSLFYLQVPVYAQYRLNVAEDVNILFQAGPYVGAGLFGRQSIISKKTKLTDDKHKKITFGNDNSKDIYNAIDYGIGAGVGIEFFRFQFVVAYDFGLSTPLFNKDAKSSTYNVDIRNHNLSVTLAVIFGRRDPLQNKKD
jgi:hypothetical protein